jgi:hypothetical protein
MTFVFHVNLIWILIKNYVLASCFVPLEFPLKICFCVLLSHSVFNFRERALVGIGLERPMGPGSCSYPFAGYCNHT